MCDGLLLLGVPLDRDCVEDLHVDHVAAARLTHHCEVLGRALEVVGEWLTVILALLSSSLSILTLGKSAYRPETKT